LPYFAATDTNLSMSGGPLGGAGSLISMTKCSNPPGVHCSNTLAGWPPSTGSPVRDPAWPVDEGPRFRMHFLLAAQEGHPSLKDVKGLVLGVVHVPGRFATWSYYVSMSPKAPPVCSAVAITRVGTPRNHSASPSSLGDTGEGSEAQRKEKVLRSIVHRLETEASFREGLREEYVRRNCTRSEIEEILINPELMHAAREHMEEAFESGEPDPGDR
jgi:hypothetical protein